MSPPTDNSDSMAPSDRDSVEKDEARGAAEDPGASAGRENAAQPNDRADATSSRSSGPLVPDPIRPPEGAVIDQRSVTFEWEHVPDAETYELQIATDRRFESLAFDGRVGASSRFTYSGLPPQEGVSLFWRVRAFRSEDGWTEYGTVGAFEVVDWRPDQPEIPESDEVQGAADDGADADASWWRRAAPLIAIITVVALGLVLLYSQWDTGSDATGEMTLPGDTINLHPQQPIPNDDGKTYRISIDEAMKRYVEKSGGTWQEDTSSAPEAEPQTP